MELGPPARRVPTRPDALGVLLEAPVPLPPRLPSGTGRRSPGRLGGPEPRRRRVEEQVARGPRGPELRVLPPPLPVSGVLVVVVGPVLSVLLGEVPVVGGGPASREGHGKKGDPGVGPGELPRNGS